MLGNLALGQINGRTIESYSTGFVRQTVNSASVDTSGYASFISIGTGLAVNISATTTNIKINAAGGATDRSGTVTANTTISSLTASSTLYLYADIASDGSVTFGFTTLAPIYQQGGTPSVTSGQFTFNIGEMKGYVGNGTTAPQAYRVFIGEAVTGASAVTSVVNYALNGNTIIKSATLALSSIFAYNHYIGAGIVPRTNFSLKCVVANNNYVVGDEINRWIDGLTGVGDTAVSVSTDATTVRTSLYSSNFTIMNKTTANTPVSSAVTNWQMIFRINRGW